MDKMLSLDMRQMPIDAAHILKVWKANREFRMKNATLADFEAAHDELNQVLKVIDGKHLELEKLRKARYAAAAKLWSLCIRARIGMKGYFGPDSPQALQTSRNSAKKTQKTVRSAKPDAAE